MYNYNLSVKQKRYLKIKRALDFLFSILLLIALSPVFLVASFLVLISSKGPIIFKQKRPGLNQKIFTIYKFRTLKTEIKKNGKVLLDNERMTPIGNFLRKTSVDELPQLVNILKGEMSFIGPRPLLLNDLKTYKETQLIRFMLLPGISSWSAVNGRNMLTQQQKYDFEVYYVKNISFSLDVKIFFKTIFLVLSGKNVVDKVNKPRIAAEIVEDINEIE